LTGFFSGVAPSGAQYRAIGCNRATAAKNQSANVEETNECAYNCMIGIKRSPGFEKVRNETVHLPSFN
jgi:hypothetical protein